MEYIFSFLSVLFLTASNTPDLPDGFSIQSLAAIENNCPDFGKSSSDAALVMHCDGNLRHLQLAKRLNFDGASYIRDPDAHAKEILLDVGKIIKEDLSIESRKVLCEMRRYILGRCKTLYILTGQRVFYQAALAINPEDDKINSFSYYFVLSWERSK